MDREIQREREKERQCKKLTDNVTKLCKVNSIDIDIRPYKQGSRYIINKDTEVGQCSSSHRGRIKSLESFTDLRQKYHNCATARTEIQKNVGDKGLKCPKSETDPNNIEHDAKIQIVKQAARTCSNEEKKLREEYDQKRILEQKKPVKMSNKHLSSSETKQQFEQIQLAKKQIEIDKAQEEKDMLALHVLQNKSKTKKRTHGISQKKYKKQYKKSSRK